MPLYFSNRTQRWISPWLILVMFLIIAIIVLGGATRLTNSGLSITEWKPITGIFLPANDAEWMVEFEKYKQIPEFLTEHPDMNLKGFQFIYSMEWGHRLLGRLIGVVYALPLLYLLLRQRIPSGSFIKLFTIFLLIGLQGYIGWWMVSSGLVDDRTDVSQYRLATHLGLAFLILGLTYWTWLGLRELSTIKQAKPIFKLQTSLLAITIYLQIIAGAFVAGTHAGKTYNSWPLMDGQFIPEGYDQLSPFWRNFFENIAAIQFNHRLIAYVIVVLSVILFISSWLKSRLRLTASILLFIVFIQVGLGIITLMHIAPVNLSLAHQFTSILVFLCSLWALRASFQGH